jgi:thiol:disulfide interchange protein DsbG
MSIEMARYFFYRVMMKKYIFMAAAALVLAAPAVAQDGVYRHPQLTAYEEAGGTVEYLGHAYGLDGWLMMQDEESTPRTVYTTPYGGLVTGVLFGPRGEVETKKQMEALKSRVEGSQAAAPGAEKSFSQKAEQFYAAVEKSAFVRVGDVNAPYIYIIVNVNCADCKSYWTSLKPHVESGKLQVRIVPFGRSPANRDGGAALLSVDDPAAAWDKYIAGDTAALAKSLATAAAADDIASNSKLLQDFKLKGNPPYTVYKHLATGKVMSVTGQPQNLMLLMADLIR